MSNDEQKSEGQIPATVVTPAKDPEGTLPPSGNAGSSNSGGPNSTTPKVEDVEPEGAVEVQKPEPAEPKQERPQILAPDAVPTNVPQPMDEYLDPVRVNQMYTLASVYFKAGCFTKDCKNVEQVFVKMQAGREMGLRPMEAMNDLALIYGVTTFWGAGLVKRFRRFGYRIEYKDEVSNFDYKSSKGQKAQHVPSPSDIPRSNTVS